MEDRNKMEDRNENIFQICPKCHIGYDMNNINFFDHILKCDGRSDIITTRFYTEKQFYQENKPLKQIVIEPFITKRPVTR